MSKVTKIQEDTEQVFDQHAHQYREVHNESLSKVGFDSYYISEQKVRVLKQVKLVQESTRINKILDIGCGDGGMAIYFRKHFPNASYYGIDISEESIKIANDRQLENCDFRHSSGEKIPFDDHTFDLVMIAGVVMHVPKESHADFLKEANRILAKDGIMAIFEHNPYNPVTRRIVKLCPFDQRVVLSSPSYLKNILANFGQKNTETRFSLFFPNISIFKYMLPFEKQLYFVPLGGQYCLAMKKV
ncbi:MAG: class I SAM-dependent methyltransferase [Pseudarcicella sp.]|nr:class I SAM-dependent methyltransferase [Pseudarcicella sp.]MBP6411379.1 class I SAM-dependent methyltransferase [Pseudarcicella sp.]